MGYENRSGHLPLWVVGRRCKDMLPLWPWPDKVKAGLMECEPIRQANAKAGVENAHSSKAFPTKGWESGFVTPDSGCIAAGIDVVATCHRQNKCQPDAGAHCAGKGLLQLAEIDHETAIHLRLEARAEVQHLAKNRLAQQRLKRIRHGQSCDGGEQRALTFLKLNEWQNNLFMSFFNHLRLGAWHIRPYRLQSRSTYPGYNLRRRAAPAKFGRPGYAVALVGGARRE